MFNLWKVFSWQSTVFECVKTMYRSSRPEVFFQKGVLKNLAQENAYARASFSWSYMLRPTTSLKKRLTLTRCWHRCFPVNFAKFLRTSFLTEHLRWLLLDLIDSTNLLFGSCVYQECMQTWIWMIITEK